MLLAYMFHPSARLRSILGAIGLITSCAWLVACGGSSPATDAGSDAADARSVCASDLQCDDGLFCNGLEICEPSSPIAEANGCAPGRACEAGRTCDESTASCLTECDVSGDADGDGHDAIECGGDDCDDSDADAYPGNVERCDTRHDEDCDPTTLGDRDADGDGVVDHQCCNPNGPTLLCGTDCDDTTLARRPGQLEICDGVDNDCDDVVDEDTSAVDWFIDSDGDGFGAPDSAMNSCAPLPGRSLVDSDCDDSRRDVSPVGTERCNGRDDDCDGQVDEGCPGADAGADGGVDAGADAGADSGVDAGVDASMDAGATAFRIAEPCSIDTDCGDGRVCVAQWGATKICHDVCASDADCDRSTTGRACVWDDPLRYCSHPCDLFGQAGCVGSDVCGFSNYIFTEMLDAGAPVRDAYLECVPVGGFGLHDVCTQIGDCMGGLMCGYRNSTTMECQQQCQLGSPGACPAGESCCTLTDTPKDALGRRIGRCRTSCS